MFSTMLIAVMAVAIGLTSYFLLKKAVKLAVMVMCVSAAFFVLKYFLGVS